jgi:hypothetical protein
MEFRVIWETDVDAKNVVEAAKEARDMQLSPKSTATVFKVGPSSEKTREFDIGPMEPVKEPMDISFALFNSHINDAQDRAKDAFIGFFGKEAWETDIQPHLDYGVMSILRETPTIRTQFYVYTIWTMVNKY